MRRPTLALIVVAILAGALAWWLWRAPPSDGTRAATRRVDVNLPRGSASLAPGIGTARDEQAQPESGPPPDSTPDSAHDYGAQFRGAGDYLEFAQDILPAARDGDAGAQFYLSQALGYCGSLYEWYFIERSREGSVRHRTLDEAQQISASRPFFDADDIRQIQGRCQRLRSLANSPLGDANEWFDAALAQRFPMAQVQAANHLALQAMQRGDAAKARIAREEARRLALEALRTGENVVLLEVAGVSAALAGEGSSEGSQRRLSWLLAASLRDGKSAELREWMRITCHVDTQCQPYESPADVILRRAGNSRDEVERRAHELNGKLDAGTLEESDIG